jgi:hypothetical protein
MQAALLDPADSQWPEALEKAGHDIYHLPQYAVLDAALTGSTAAAFWFEQGGQHLLVPLILRDIPGTSWRDAASPYGYPGPVSQAAAEDTDFWDQACAAFGRTLAAHGVVTAFVRMHPMLPAPREVMARHGAMVLHGETVSMDLTISVEDMWSLTRSDHRNHINRARRAGTRVLFDDWDRLGEWVDVYHDNMRRVGANEFYFFTREHLEAMRDAVGERMHFACALEGDEVVGGNTFFEYDGIATGYVSSTRRAKNRYADELLYDEVRRFCKGRGNTLFHLGGGKGGCNDSLFTYKAGFSPQRHAFHTWRVVADPEAYRSLMSDRRPDVDPNDLTAAFPSYRQE